MTDSVKTVHIEGAFDREAWIRKLSGSKIDDLDIVVVDVAKGEFQPERRIVLPYQVNKFTVGGKKVVTVSSPVVYVTRRGRQDVAGIPCYILPEQVTFPPGWSWPYSVDHKNIKPTDLPDGMQQRYPLTSLKTVQAPTEGESYTKELFDFIHETTVEEIQRYAKFAEEAPEGSKDEEVCPPGFPLDVFKKIAAEVNKDRLKAATKRGAGADWAALAKPVFEPGTKKAEEAGDKRVVDPELPWVTYFKLMTTGKNTAEEPNKMRVETPYFLPGDRQVNPKTLMTKFEPGKTVFAKITPSIKDEGIVGRRQGGPHRLPQAQALRLQLHGDDPQEAPRPRVPPQRRQGGGRGPREQRVRLGL